MIQLKYTFAILFSFITIQNVLSQPVKQEDFSVTFLSSNIKTDINQLQQRVKAANSFEDIKIIVQSTINSTSGSIVIRFKEGENYFWWKRMFGPSQPNNKVEKWIILGKRDFDNYTIKELSDFSKYLGNKFVIFDTLALKISLKDHFLSSTTDYQFLLQCDSINEKEVSIPFHPKGQLLIHPQLFSNCQRGNISFRMINKAAPDLTLVSGDVEVVNSEMENEFLSVVKALRNTFPGISLADQADYLSSYIQAFYGEVVAGQHLAWLSKNKSL